MDKIYQLHRLHVKRLRFNPLQVRGNLQWTTGFYVTPANIGFFKKAWDLPP